MADVWVQTMRITEDQWKECICRQGRDALFCLSFEIIFIILLGYLCTKFCYFFKESLKNDSDFNVKRRENFLTRLW